ncbi:MAG: hypothetical protein VXZ40_02780 [Nanoarchaeota archaeon]|nr:hypothetical protein [Nanoarchaeota archaeon]
MHQYTFPTREEGFSQEDLNNLNNKGREKGLYPLVFGNEVQSGVHSIRTNWWENSDMISRIKEQYIQESRLGGIITPIERVSVTTIFPKETSARMNVVLNSYFEDFHQSSFGLYLNQNFDFEESKTLDSSISGFTTVFYTHTSGPEDFLDNLKKIEHELFKK